MVILVNGKVGPLEPAAPDTAAIVTRKNTMLRRLVEAYVEQVAFPDAKALEAAERDYLRAALEWEKL